MSTSEVVDVPPPRKKLESTGAHGTMACYDYVSIHLHQLQEVASGSK